MPENLDVDFDNCAVKNNRGEKTVMTNGLTGFRLRHNNIPGITITKPEKNTTDNQRLTNITSTGIFHLANNTIVLSAEEWHMTNHSM